MDIGLQGNISMAQHAGRLLNETERIASNFELDGQEIMLLTDIDSDMFTDIISLDKTRKKVIVHLFDSATSNYT